MARQIVVLATCNFQIVIKILLFNTTVISVFGMRLMIKILETMKTFSLQLQRYILTLVFLVGDEETDG